MAATKPFRVHGEWTNFSGFEGAFKKAADGIAKVADLFEVQGLKKTVRAYKEAQERYHRTVAEYGAWFKAYPDGGPAPAGLKRDLEYWAETELPSYDSIVEELPDGEVARVLTRAQKDRYGLERAILEIYDYAEKPSAETADSARRAKEQIKRYDLDDQENVYQRFAQLDPDSYEEFQASKKWIGEVLETADPAELMKLLDLWEDAIGGFGDEGGENLINRVLERQPLQASLDADEVVREIERASNRLLDHIGL